ncbi:MAG: sterol desaturase family protein [Cyclobacteriaceae bacterium]|nr:sterol desaturase family protein [Cyclobacteriaceae bacterium]MDH5250902.1 sterol desaturase family protein [Cyclobacteriaceae bacterium]
MFKTKIQHLLRNLLLQSTVIVMASSFALITVLTFDWIGAHKFGLFYWTNVPFWFIIIAGIFVLDMADYWIHRVDHTYPLLWRQHRVHHSDTSMDASTALRTFPTDNIYFICGELLFAVIFGLDILSINIFYFIFLPVSFFHHSNLKYPDWLDKGFGWLIVTPNFHKVHHEQDQAYTDTNYGSLFIIWDRLFGTFRTKSVKDIKYGLKEFEGDEKQSALFLIRSPFVTIKRSPGKDYLDHK